MELKQLSDEQLHQFIKLLIVLNGIETQGQVTVDGTSCLLIVLNGIETGRFCYAYLC